MAATAKMDDRLDSELSARGTACSSQAMARPAPTMMKGNGSAVHAGWAFFWPSLARTSTERWISRMTAKAASAQMPTTVRMTGRLEPVRTTKATPRPTSEPMLMTM